MNHRPLAVLMLAGALLLSARTTALQADNAAPGTAGGIANTAVAERRMDVAIRTELERLRQREQALDQRELELKTLSAEVDKRLSELEKVREEVSRLTQRKDEQEAGKIKLLSQMYERMEPANAAAVLAKLEQQLAVEILQGMKVKAAGRILDNMDPASAVTLSRSFPTLARD